MVNKEQILEFFGKEGRRPLPFREIAARMGVKAAGRKALKRALRDLCQSGKMVLTKRGLYGPIKEMELITGYFEAHREGFGFVIQDKPGQRDLFIPPRASKGAMDSDRVVASVINASKNSGKIVRVLERAHSRVAGIVEPTGGACFVVPKNRRIPFEIFITSGCRGMKQGQAVIVEITEYPRAKGPATGKILKKIDKAESARDDIEAIIEEHSLPVKFQTKVLSAARKLKDKDFTEGRKDLTALNTVTIDGETAKDFDDAISIKRTAEGYTLWVHIADVGFYVEEGDAIDKEAYGRATSIYFPDRVIPMLPKELSEDLCSLKPGVQRPAFTIEMRLDKKGKPRNSKFYTSIILSNERMTYTSVSKILIDKDEAEREKYSAMLGDFELMEELARLIRDKRLKRGSLDFDLPEPEIVLDMTGNPENVIKAERNFAHMIIEEFMVAANEAVASTLADRGLPCMYRVHEEPDKDKIAELMAFAPLPVAKKSTKNPMKLHKALEKVKGLPGEEVFNYLVLRAMKQARYSEENIGHFGLASEKYCHFTSPIRRYPDLVVHRILRKMLDRGNSVKAINDVYNKYLPDSAAHCSRMERSSMDAEREVMASLKAWFMKDKLGQEFDATIMGITPNGIKIRLSEFFIEGFIAVSELSDDYYRFNELDISLKGKNSGRVFKFGQSVRVSVDRVDLEQREVIFGLVLSDDVELDNVENPDTPDTIEKVNQAGKPSRKRRRK